MPRDYSHLPIAELTDDELAEAGAQARAELKLHPHRPYRGTLDPAVLFAEWSKQDRPLLLRDLEAFLEGQRLTARLLLEQMPDDVVETVTWIAEGGLEDDAFVAAKVRDAYRRFNNQHGSIGAEGIVDGYAEFYRRLRWIAAERIAA